MRFFILELETGFIDGWYSDSYEEDELDGIKAHWDLKRPSFSHLICSTDDGFYLHNNRCLNRANPDITDEIPRH